MVAFDQFSFDSTFAIVFASGSNFRIGVSDGSVVQLIDVGTGGLLSMMHDADGFRLNSPLQCFLQNLERNRSELLPQLICG